MAARRKQWSASPLSIQAPVPHQKFVLDCAPLSIAVVVDIGTEAEQKKKEEMNADPTKDNIYLQNMNM